MSRWSWIALLAALLLSFHSGVAGAQQIVIVTGDGMCPSGMAPLSLAMAQANQQAICQQLGQWFIARLEGGGSIDGPGYGCGIRNMDGRQLGHTICGTAQPAYLPPQFGVVPGIYDGRHPHWQDVVIIEPDGTYRRGNGDPGHWWVEGNMLVLGWQNWGPERLIRVGDNYYQSPDGGFTLSLRPSALVVAPVIVQPPPVYQQPIIVQPAPPPVVQPAPPPPVVVRPRPAPPPPVVVRPRPAPPPPVVVRPAPPPPRRGTVVVQPPRGGGTVVVQPPGGRVVVRPR